MAGPTASDFHMHTQMSLGTWSGVTPDIPITRRDTMLGEVRSAAAVTAAMPLRGRMRRRVPSPAELAHQPPIELTARDRRILGAVYTHGFLTTELIELAYFPPPPAGRQ